MQSGVASVPSNPTNVPAGKRVTIIDRRVKPLVNAHAGSHLFAMKLGWLIILLLCCARGVTADWNRELDSLESWLTGQNGWNRTRLAAPLSLELEGGHLEWEKGLARRIVFPFLGDSLQLVELYGRGHWRLGSPDSLEARSLQAFTGKLPFEDKPGRMTLLLAGEHDFLQGTTFREASGFTFDFLRPRADLDHLAFRQHEGGALALWALHRARGGHPEDFVWMVDPGSDRTWYQADGQSALHEPLHSGSQVQVPLMRHMRPAVEAALAHPGYPEAAWTILDQQLHTSDGTNGSIKWRARFQILPERGLPLVWLLLDPEVELTAVARQGVDLPLELLDHGTGSILLGVPDSCDTLLLELDGTSPARTIDHESGQLAIPRNWFPRAPWWHAVFPVEWSQEDGQELECMARGHEGLLIGDARLPLLMSRPANRSSKLDSLLVVGHTEWRPALSSRRPMAPEPDPLAVDYIDAGAALPPVSRSVHNGFGTDGRWSLGQGADSVLQAELALLSSREELVQAHGMLRTWLGGSEAVWIPEVDPDRRQRNRERALLTEHDLPPRELPALDAAVWQGAQDHAALDRLETLALVWAQPRQSRAGASPRWMAAGWSRAVGLLLLAEVRGEASARALRRRAREWELNRFRPHQEASFPLLGERAEGSWYSRDVQDAQAWRFCLLLESLRWRLRDPAGSNDRRYFALLRELRPHVRSPRDWRNPVHSLASGLATALDRLHLLAAAGFLDQDECISWLLQELARTSYPNLRVGVGKLAVGDGMAQIRIEQKEPLEQGILPLLLGTDAGYSLVHLAYSRQDELFTLPVKASELREWSPDPGVSQLARIRTR